MARVLVVDDDPGIRDMLRAILQSVGHTVLEANDGFDGLRSVYAGPVDVILCDLFLPGKNGLVVIRELRRERPDLPIVAMSGGGFSGELDLLPAAWFAGAVQVLRKPFGATAVLPAVQQALAARPAEGAGR